MSLIVMASILRIMKIKPEIIPYLSNRFGKVLPRETRVLAMQLQQAVYGNVAEFGTAVGSESIGIANLYRQSVEFLLVRQNLRGRYLAEDGTVLRFVFQTVLGASSETGNERTGGETEPFRGERRR